jgi:lysophospholipase L1-like esterase
MKALELVIKPGLFEDGAAANNRREEFDYQNTSIVCNDIEVDLCFIGDSITHFWELNAYFKNYGLVINRGIGGDIVENVYRRLTADVIQLKPKIAVISVGVNNTWFLDELVMNKSSNENIENLSIKNLEKMLDYYQKIINLAKVNNQKICITSILPTRSLKLRNEYIVQINLALKELCVKERISYIDYHQSMVDSDGVTLKGGLDFDTIHPHVVGYNIMAQKLIEKLDYIVSKK